MSTRKLDLPGWPRGLSRQLAAAYVGVSPSLFDKLVADGRMPMANHLNSRRVWDIHAIDQAFTELSGVSSTVWDRVSNDHVIADLGGPSPRRPPRPKTAEARDGNVAKGRWPDHEKLRAGEYDFSEEARIVREAKWEAMLLSSPLGIRETAALEGYFRGKGQMKLNVHGAGPATVDCLLVRGFIEVVAQRGEGKEPYYGITPAGEDAWRQLCGSHGAALGPVVL